MMPEPNATNGAPKLTGRPFPWHCPKCRKKEVWLATISYRTKRLHEGRLVTIDIPDLSVPRCRNCGELVLNYSAEEQITRAFRAQVAESS